MFCAAPFVDEIICFVFCAAPFVDEIVYGVFGAALSLVRWYIVWFMLLVSLMR